MDINGFALMILNSSLVLQIIFFIFMLIYKKTSNYNYISLVIIFALSLQLAHFFYFASFITVLISSIYVGLYSILFCASFTLNIIYNVVLWKKLDIIEVYYKDIMRNLKWKFLKK